MKYPKRSQYSYAKSRYGIRDWPQYEAGLRSRGDLTVWLSDAAPDAWRAPPSGKPGGQLPMGLRRIFEVDPLRCPRCGHEMRIVAFIIQPRVIDRILTHLRRIATEPRRTRAPPRRWTSPHTTTSV